VTSSSSAADPMTASSAGNPDDRSTAEPPLLGPVVRGVTPPSGVPEARPGSFAPPFAATAPHPAPVAQPEPAAPSAEPEPVVDVPVEEEPVALAGAEETWDDGALEEALASDASGPELEFLDGGAWQTDAATAEEPAAEALEAEGELEPTAARSQPPVEDPAAGWGDELAEPGADEREAVAEVEVETAAPEDEHPEPRPEPLPGGVEILRPGDDERTAAELPAAALLEEPEAADSLAARYAPEPEPDPAPTPPAVEAEPGLAEVAERLERLAASLRQGAPPPIPAADGPADPLEVLITGYALGYAEALRRRSHPPAG
jgi:hypothetical protein